MRVTALAVAFLSVSLAAQEHKAPTPAPELAKLKPLIGNWEGKGTVTMGPGAPPTEWNARSSYELVLGGHFVRGDMHITFAGDMPPLVFREYIGWDRETKRYRTLAVSNTGEGSLIETVIPDAVTFVSFNAKKAEGMPIVERSVTKVTNDGMDFTMTIMPWNGAGSDAVTGKFKRVESLKPLAIEAAAAMGPLEEASSKMNRLAGTYQIEGEMVMMPGSPPMKIRGTDDIRPIFGGVVLAVSTKGTSEHSPDPYLAESFTVWNSDKQCYESFGADNMGWIGCMEQYFTDDDKLIATNAAVYMGRPTTNRMVMELDEKGRPTSATCHSCCGTADPYCSFKASYKRVD